MRLYLKYFMLMASLVFSNVCHADDTPPTALSSTDVETAKQVLQSNGKNFERIFQYKASGVKGKNQDPDQLDNDAQTADPVNFETSYIRIDAVHTDSVKKPDAPSQKNSTTPKDPTAQTDPTTPKVDPVAQKNCYDAAITLLTTEPYDLLQSTSKIRGTFVEGDSTYVIADTPLDASATTGTVMTIKDSDFDNFEHVYSDDKSLFRMLHKSNDSFSPLLIMQPVAKAKDSTRLTIITIQDILGSTDAHPKLCTVGTVSYFTNYASKKPADDQASKAQADKDKAAAVAADKEKKGLAVADEEKKAANLDIPKKIKVGCQSDSLNLELMVFTMSGLLLVRRKRLS